MKALNQLKTFQRILAEFPAETPLSKFLPGFYRQNKQMGSTDRKVASRLIYNYFRLGKALGGLPSDERLSVAEFLCNTQTNSFLQYFKPEWAASASLDIDEKLALITAAYPSFDISEVFPWIEHLTAGIDRNAFLRSFFVQPDLFIRVRKDYEALVKGTLSKTDVTFRECGEGCLALPNGTRLDSLFPQNCGFQVQDYSSQQTARFFRPYAGEAWWDACAGSGGKSLLLHELQPDLRLVVSDIRESVLSNLDERFQNAGLRKYQKKLLDLTQNPDPVLHDYRFDGIVLDIPCSGSGTWGRTPEMISQFSSHRIEAFRQLQQTIVRNVLRYLKPRKPLVYITCSAFREENEDIVQYMAGELGMHLETSEVLKGYRCRADTMFVARLCAP